MAFQVTALILVGTLAWRIGSGTLWVSGFSLSDLLALLLALFAIGLSAAFYFQTTETSNRFYDNSLNFTKGISETLGRIEERFGERLRHIDEGYSNLHNKLLLAESTVEGTAEQIKSEEQEAERIAEEREALLDDLLKRAEVDQQERDAILAQLRSMEGELDRARHQVHVLQRAHAVAQARAEELRDASDRDVSRSHTGGLGDGESLFTEWLASWVRDRILEAPESAKTGELSDFLRRAFEGRLGNHPAYQEAIEFGFYHPEDGWTERGLALIHREGRRVRSVHRATWREPRSSDTGA